MKALRFGTVGFLVGTGVMSCFLDVFKVTSGSMRPKIREGDYILVFTPRIKRWIPQALWAAKRQSIVVVSLPGDNGGGDHAVYVKRIAAEAGDRVRIDTGTLILNDIPFSEPHVYYSSPAAKLHDTWPLTLTHRRNVVIPYGCFFLLGDNRAESVDSRVWGSLDKSAVKGVVIFSWHLTKGH